jgi:hypothetical protein
LQLVQVAVEDDALVTKAPGKGGGGTTGSVSSRIESLRRRLQWSFVWLPIWIVFGPVSAAAARDLEHGVALNWVRQPGAEGCITAAELARRVEHRLERTIFVVDEIAALSVDGAVQPVAPGFSVRLALSDRDGRVLGERVVQSAETDCRALDEAVVLIIAVTLFPQRLLAAGGGMSLEIGTERLLQELFRDEPTELDWKELEPNTELEPDSAPDAVVVGVAPANTRLASAHWIERERERPLLSLAAGALMTAGYLPGLAPGIELVFTLSPATVWPLRLAASYLPEQTVPASMLGSGTTSFGVSQAALGACPWQMGNVLHAQLCAGAALGVLRTTSRAYARGGSERSDLMFDAQAQFDLQWRVLTHIVLQLGAGLALPFIQRRYAYQGLDGQSQPLFRTTQLTGRLSLGLGVGF